MCNHVRSNVNANYQHQLTGAAEQLSTARTCTRFIDPLQLCLVIIRFLREEKEFQEAAIALDRE